MNSGKRTLAWVAFGVAVLRLYIGGLRMYHDFGGASSSETTDFAKVGQALHSALTDLGSQLQMARECGIPEDRMTGHWAAYDRTIVRLDAVQKDPTLSRQDKVLLGTSALAKMTVQQAAEKTHALSPQEIASRCPGVRENWDDEDAKLMAKAQADAKRDKR